MKARSILITAALVFTVGLPEAEAKKKKPPAEPVDVMCPEKGKKLTFAGKLFSIQPAAREITVRTESGAREFRIAGNCKLSTAAKPAAQLTDLRLGEDIRVTYFITKSGTQVACAIEPASRPAGKKSGN